MQPQQQVDLVSSGGHVANFEGAVEFPYRFLLKHFPIRSPDHGRRKVMTERKGRWSPEERAMGWHIQYDGYHAGSRYLWDATDLIQFTDAFWENHGLAVITDIARDGLRSTWRSNPPSALSTSVEEVADRLAVLTERWTAEQNAYDDIVETLSQRILALENMLATIRDEITAKEQALTQRYRTAIRRQQF